MNVGGGGVMRRVASERGRLGRGERKGGGKRKGRVRRGALVRNEQGDVRVGAAGEQILTNLVFTVDVLVGVTENGLIEDGKIVSAFGRDEGGVPEATLFSEIDVQRAQLQWVA